MSHLKITLAQINLTVGDLEGNCKSVVRVWQQAENLQAELVIFPELTISGYSPQDLALRHDYIESCAQQIQLLLQQSLNFKSAVIVGTIIREIGEVYNSALVIHQGKIIHRYDKIFLPNYGVFDEKRVFSCRSIEQAIPFTFKDVNIGILICEDLWYPEPCSQLKNNGAELIIVLNASPYSKFKFYKRLQIVRSRQHEVQLPIIYVNQVGCQDSVVYDGGSFALKSSGEISLQLPFFESQLGVLDSSTLFTGNFKHPFFVSQVCEDISLNLSNEVLKDIYLALMLSLRDYLAKNNMNEVVLGFSSGIDSSLTAVIAMDAIGRNNVHLMTLPSAYTSSSTFSDAVKFIEYNNTSSLTLSIENAFQTLLSQLQPYFGDEAAQDVTEQNIQSRIRGIILMALANKHRYLLLSTGNKSELAVGYATLYGDMNGGYNLLKDLYKLEVYQLAHWRNQHIPAGSLHPYQIVIPESIISKAPTAELKENQKDEDSLPPYEILDNILYNYIEKRLSKAEIIQLGYSSEIVDQVLNLVRIAQFKRQQATLGPRISEASFDLDWRYPITNKFY